LKALFENYLKSSIYFLKNFFEKDQVPKILFSILYSNLIKLACKEVSHQCALFRKVCILKELCLKDNFKHYFIKYYLFKRIYFANPNLFCIMQAKPFAKFIKPF
jgi:hypothetical protein